MTTRLDVDLDLLASNIAHIRSSVAPAEMMLVVKDDAYGHGLAPVIRRAAAEGVRWFGAFDLATGRAARTVLGDEARIFVWMTANADEAAEAVDERLDIGVGDAEVLEDVAASAVARGVRARIHLKIDTGLHRNGVRPEQWSAFVARAASLQAGGAVDVAGVWSHIAEASDAEDDAARDAFERALEQARAAGLTPAHRHLAASAASFARPEFRYDLVRVGAFAHGIRSAGGPALSGLGLELTSRLRADVVRVDSESVALGIGSLDGLSTILSGRANVGTSAGPQPILEIGLTETLVAPWAGASVGDVVTVFGGAENEESPTDLAEAIESVGEEILVRLSPLVPRRYVGRRGAIEG